MRYNLWITSLLLIFVGSSSSNNPENVSSRCVQSMFNQTQAFGMRLTNLLLWSWPNQNLLISPVNVISSLTLVHLGSDGETRSQLSSVLGIPNTSLIQKLHRTVSNMFDIKIKPEFKSTVEVFVDTAVELKNTFVLLSNAIYLSKIYKIDFSHPSSSTAILNKYTASITQNRIQPLFQHILSENIKILISSYANFQAEWENKFDTKRTRKRIFYLSSRSTIMVDTLDKLQSHHNPIHFAEISSLKIRTVRLKFFNARYSMYIVLPDALKSSLDNFLSYLNSNTIRQIIDQTIGLYAVYIRLPKFTFKWSKIINEQVQKLGIDEIFTKNSNLNGMVNGTTSIHAVVHSAHISVNEYGVGINQPTRGSLTGPLKLRLVKFFFVERPFFFFIYDHNINSVLFYSAVYNPSI